MLYSYQIKSNAKEKKLIKTNRAMLYSKENNSDRDRTVIFLYIANVIISMFIKQEIIRDPRKNWQKIKKKWSE